LLSEDNKSKNKFTFFGVCSNKNYLSIRITIKHPVMNRVQKQTNTMKNSIMKKVLEVKKGKYDYSLLDIDFPDGLIYSQSKVRIICNKHGIFETESYLHLKGVGCPKCETDKYNKEEITKKYLLRSDNLIKKHRTFNDNQKLNLWKQRAVELMEEFKLSDWSFCWLNTKSVYGRCMNDSKLICLSIPYILACTDDLDIEDTIRHEIGHALTPDDKGHGKEWKAMAKKVGYTPKRCSEFIY